MKRSHAIALGATGVILAGAWLGRGSGDESKDAAIFSDTTECVRSGLLTREQCEEQYRNAEANHLAAAPKFANSGECENQYGAGQCKPASFNGASVFVPAMIGMMVANHLSNNRRAQALLPPQRGIPLCPPGVTPQMQPGCVVPRQASSSSSSSSSSSGWRSYSTSSGYGVSRQDGPTNATARVPGAATTPPAPRHSLGAVSARSSSIGTSSSASSSRSGSTVSRGGFGSTGRSISSGS
ncbi:MAG: DUF1190 domain-containing protein [Proteobacteria bacterium]|nr:DUF1190 domain-containing protein [Pseudomonadota bacterium]